MPAGDELLCGTMAVVRREASASARTVVVGDSTEAIASAAIEPRAKSSTALRRQLRTLRTFLCGVPPGGVGFYRFAPILQCLHFYHFAPKWPNFYPTPTLWTGSVRGVWHGTRAQGGLALLHRRCVPRKRTVYYRTQSAEFEVPCSCV